MTTADLVSDRAVELAGSETDPEAAVRQLLELAGDHRVAVVRARQLLLAGAEDPPVDPIARAVSLLDEALARIPV
jgi:hypothetical protein